VVDFDKSGKGGQVSAAEPGGEDRPFLDKALKGFWGRVELRKGVVEA